MVDKIFKPWLLLPVTWAHKLSPKFLNLAYAWRSKENKNFTWQPKTWKHLKFRNPSGLAGGADKNAQNIKAWWALGVGFVEIGTVTPFAQTANLGPNLARDLKLTALWNCLGFPNDGCQKIKKRLSLLPPKEKRPTPIFVNIGKNRWTKNEEAHEDYCYLIKNFYDLADAFVINISSPNTSGLRDLFQEENLKKFLQPIFLTYQSLTKTSKESNKTFPPLLLKLSPDLSDKEIQILCQNILNTPIQGLILTNTTTERTPEMSFASKKGGVSGAPLKQTSIEVLKTSLESLGDKRSDFLIISAGGVMSKTDMTERLELGADLIQVYSALIFKGPNFFKHLRK